MKKTLKIKKMSKNKKKTYGTAIVFFLVAGSRSLDGKQRIFKDGLNGSNVPVIETNFNIGKFHLAMGPSVSQIHFQKLGL